MRAQGAFTVDNRTETPVEWHGATMNRARWSKTFTGDIAGTSYIEFVMGELDGDGSGELARVYVGVERLDCAVHGRKGTFVLVHVGSALGVDHKASWTILPGSGTGELAGISGSAQIMPNHDFVLTYELG